MQKVNFLLVKLSVISKITNGVQSRLLVILQWIEKQWVINYSFTWIFSKFPVPQNLPQEKKVLRIIMVAGIFCTS